MTNIYALKFEIDGNDEEIILNALNQTDAVRKAELWFVRKFRRKVPRFYAKPVASIVICGNEKEIICQASEQHARAVMVL